MKNTSRRVADISEELQTRAEFCQVIIAVPPGVSAAKVRRVQENLGRPLPQSMVDFYRELDGLTLRWQHQGCLRSFGPVRGRSYIRPLGTVFDPAVRVAEDGVWTAGSFFGNNQGEFLGTLEEYRVLDELEGCSHVVFSVTDPSQDPALYLFTQERGLWPLRVRFTEYIKLLVKTRGMYFWQEYATSDEYPIDGRMPDRFHQNMAHLFPEEDVSALRPEVAPVQSSSFNTLRQRDRVPDYRGLLREKVEALSGIPGLQVHSFEIRAGVSVCSLRRAAAALGRELPESMLAFYLNMNGFDMEWSYSGDTEEKIAGRAGMVSLERAFGGVFGAFRRDWDDEVHRNVLWFDGSYPEDLEFLKSLKIVDEISGESREVVARFVEGRVEPELYLLSKDGQFKLSVSFEEYLELLFETMGLEFWQDFITEAGSLNLRSRHYGGPPFFERLRQVFPSADTSRFRR